MHALLYASLLGLGFEQTDEGLSCAAEVVVSAGFVFDVLLSEMGQGLSNLTELIQKREYELVIDLLGFRRRLCARTPPPPI